MRTLQIPLFLAFAAGCAVVPEAPTSVPSQPTAPTIDPDAPRYKPSSSSAEALDITTNAYGAYGAAPDAPEIGDVAQDFKVALADGGTFDLAQARKAGPVLVMFYRGHW